MKIAYSFLCSLFLEINKWLKNEGHLPNVKTETSIARSFHCKMDSPSQREEFYEVVVRNAKYVWSTIFIKT